ncbi:MAG: NUDIX domain-containing protein, partial [Syntrophales bacterium]|nr:NUDIX domain-containing protein [Syntrophales bacterium]
MKKDHDRRFCHLCGKGVTKKTEDGIERHYCPSCHRFFYTNPLPVVSAIVAQERQILLVKRARAPYRGYWCLPTGFAET